MKKILVAGIAAAALYSAPALAGPPSGVFNWSGFYLGVNGGDMSSKAKGVFTTGGGFMPGNVSVGTAGIHGGYQAQWGSIVAGVEGGFNLALSDKFGSTFGPTAPVAVCGYASHNCDGRVNDLQTIGGRLGWALNNILFYGTGGFAYGGVEVRGGPAVAGAVTVDDSTKHHSGWYGGAGIEYGLMNNLTIGVDWKHFDLGHSVHQAGATGALIDVNDKGDAVTARLTIKGGG
jgi:outer membrane immunogenic protein